MNEYEEEAAARALARADERRMARKLQLVDGPCSDTEWIKPLRLWREGEICCAILVGPVGGLCGYAQVPEDHPWWGLDLTDEVPDPQPLDFTQPVEQAMADLGVIPVFAVMAGGEESVQEFARQLASQVQVHGGLTYAGALPVRGAAWGWWLGFDTGHENDAVDPKHFPDWGEATAFLHKLNQDKIDEGAHVWTEEEVAMEVSRMVTVIREVAHAVA